MRWVRTVPKCDDVRIVRRFAFLPKKIGPAMNGRGEVWIWLRFYFSLQKYTYVPFPIYRNAWIQKSIHERHPYPFGDLPRGETL